jgi:hypothetical protein
VGAIDPVVMSSEFGLGKRRFFIYGFNHSFNNVHIHTVQDFFF